MVLFWRDRARVQGAEVAVRVVRQVEIELVQAGDGAVEVEITARLVRLRAGRQIAERHEEMFHVWRAGLDEGRESQRLSLQRELERADAPHRTHLPARR